MKRDRALALLAEGLTNTEIGRRLGMERQTVGRIRRAAGIPDVPRQPLTLEQKWRSFVVPVDGGHMKWTGERSSTSGTPLMRYREQAYTATRIAYRIRTGHDPHGYATPQCGMKHCVAPDHVDDLTDRTRTREQLRYLTGGTERTRQCRHGHDQAQWGRYATGGWAYCHACKLAAKAGKAVTA
jgi:hypothetical protein